ncbi:MAG: PD-(D/E)XK nuclease family protein [Solirubrobacterales bacterium]
MGEAPADRPLQGVIDAQQRVVSHGSGPLILTGVAGSGRTEALALRLATLTGAGERALVLTSSHAAAERIRARAELMIEGSFEELSVHTHRDGAEILLREHCEAAGIDPFFESIGAAHRLAMLLDRLGELPLRRHEIRGNPAGLLARLIARIDALKAQAVGPAEFAQRAAERESEATGESELDAARREREFAELYARHDELVRGCGALDAGDLICELSRVLGDQSGIRAAVASQYPHLLIDEAEDAGAAERRMLSLLAGGAESFVVSCDPDQAREGAADSAPLAWLRDALDGAEEVVLEGPLRSGGDLSDAAHAVLAPIAGRAELPREPGAYPATVAFWRCRNERAQAQAAAREIESLLSEGEVMAERVCVAVPAAGDARAVAAALEERTVPYRMAGPAAFFLRPEVRDVIAWLRLLADPADAAAAVRVLTRPPVELRSVDMARVTKIAKRRKLDMVSALEAALESPQVPPEARDRIGPFLRLYRAAAKAMGEMRADVFVRRLIERVGFRRQRLFAAHPEAAERLVALSRLGDLAAAWIRREPNGSNRDFVRYLAAVSDAGVPPEDEPETPAAGAVRLLELGALKGLEFDRVYLLGLHTGALPPSDADRRRLYVGMTRAAGSLVLSWPEQVSGRAKRPADPFEEARTVLGAEQELHDEELFGPGEGLHSTYRMIRDEVLETAWKAGGSLSELRLDTYMDVQRAVVRYLEMLKLSALMQRSEEEPAAEAITAINDLLGQAVSPEQREALGASGLDEYLVEGERERRRGRDAVAAREEPSLEAFLPRRGDGLALSATDIDLYRTCPLKYKFARVFSIPQEPTINQRFGIVIHQVLERFHKNEGERPGESEAASLARLMGLFDTAWRRSGFGESNDELQFRERAVASLRRYHHRHLSSDSSPRWLERGFDFRVGPHHLRGRVDRVDELDDGRYELIDYKTGDPKPEAELAEDLQLAIYRLAAREAWQLDAEAGAYWYVLADEKVAVAGSPDDLERVERTVLSVGEGIMGQDFEPRPSPEICSWCDFRLICPASEA